MSATDTPTARDILKGLLNPAMDARAHNVGQARTVWNPSPECDSIIEYLARVQDQIPATVMGELLRLLRELLESNTAEGEHERAIARMADQMSRTQRSFECNGQRASRA